MSLLNLTLITMLTTGILNSCSSADHGGSKLESGSSVNSGVPAAPNVAVFLFRDPIDAKFAANSDWLKVKELIKKEEASDGLCFTTILQASRSFRGPLLASARLEFSDYGHLVQTIGALKQTLSDRVEVVSASPFYCLREEVTINLTGKSADTLFTQLKGISKTSTSAGNETRSVRAVTCLNGEVDQISCTIVQDLDHVTALSSANSTALSRSLNGALAQQNHEDDVASIHGVSCTKLQSNTTCALKIFTK